MLQVWKIQTFEMRMSRGKEVKNTMPQMQQVWPLGKGLQRGVKSCPVKPQIHYGLELKGLDAFSGS